MTTEKTMTLEDAEAAYWTARDACKAARDAYNKVCTDFSETVAVRNTAFDVYKKAEADRRAAFDALTKAAIAKKGAK